MRPGLVLGGTGLDNMLIDYIGIGISCMGVNRIETDYNLHPTYAGHAVFHTK